MLGVSVIILAIWVYMLWNANERLREQIEEVRNDSYIMIDHLTTRLARLENPNSIEAIMARLERERTSHAQQ